MWIPSRNMFIIVYICFIFSEFFAFLCILFYTILLYNSILYCFISNGGIFYALFWVICGRIMTIISFPGAMLFKIDTNQSIFQCHKWITEIIIIYYIKFQYLFILHIVVIQSLSHVQFFCDSVDCSMPSSSVLHCLPVCSKSCPLSQMSSNHFILCCPLLLPSVFPSIRVFSNELALFIRWAKYWSFSFSISPSNEYAGLIYFRINWFDLLAVQGTLKTLLQHHSSEASILQHSAFFIVQLSQPCMTTGKSIALTIWTFIGKRMLVNMGLSGFVLAFLPRSKRLFISWLQSPYAVIFWAQENKICHCFHIFPFYVPRSSYSEIGTSLSA